MELWGGGLGDTTYQASINRDVDGGKLYQVANFWNNLGRRDPISSGRIVGCENQVVVLMDKDSFERCELTHGDYPGSDFGSRCGNDVVTKYRSHGKLL